MAEYLLGLLRRRYARRVVRVPPERNGPPLSDREVGAWIDALRAYAVKAGPEAIAAETQTIRAARERRRQR